MPRLSACPIPAWWRRARIYHWKWRACSDPLVIYGFGNTPNDFSHVDFIGNLRNCEACHLPGTYSTEDTHNGLPTTIDTGADKSVSTDDLNISPTASVCSACHDSEGALTHMKLHGASFHALDADIN